MNERNSKIGIFLIFLFALFLLILPKYINDERKIDKVVDQRKVFVDTDGVLKKYSGQSSVITIPNEVTKIDYNAFKNNTVIEKVMITKKINYIGEVIYSKEGSYAQEYTIHNGIIFNQLLQDMKKDNRK